MNRKNYARDIEENPPEEEIRYLAKILIWQLTKNYKDISIREHNPHFNKGFVFLLEYLSAVTCDDWPASDLKGFSEELDHFNFIRYIQDRHSKEIFRRFAEICSTASGNNNVDALMNSSTEIEAWPTLIEYRIIGLTRKFLRYPGGFLERYFSKGHLYLKKSTESTTGV